jgi:hypothetical protein
MSSIPPKLVARSPHPEGTIRRKPVHLIEENDSPCQTKYRFQGTGGDFLLPYDGRPPLQHIATPLLIEYLIVSANASTSIDFSLIKREDQQAQNVCNDLNI